MNDQPFNDLKPRPARLKMRWNSSPGILAWNELSIHEKDTCLRKLDNGGITNAEWRKWMRETKRINFKSDFECSRAREIFNRQVLILKSNDKAEHFEKFLREKYPDMPPGELREYVLMLIALETAGADNKTAITAINSCRAENIFKLDREKFELLKARAAKADETEEVLDSGMTDDEVRLRIKQIYGRA